MAPRGVSAAPSSPDLRDELAPRGAGQPAHLERDWPVAHKLASGDRPAPAAQQKQHGEDDQQE
jgi:hypothetical protein